MKKTEYIFLLFFISAVAFAQNKSEYIYQPFITDGTCVWLSRREPMGETLNDIRLVISKEDSIYQGNTYKKVYKYLFCNTTEEEKEYIGIIREENKRVYYQGKQSITPFEDSEKLLYDFNLKVDDKISYTYFDKQTFRVSRIDTLQFEGIWRRKYHFVNVDDPDQELDDFWIEGIGSKKYFGLTDPFAPIPTKVIPHFRCVLDGEKILYKALYENNCLCEAGPQKITKIENKRPFKFFVKDKILHINTTKSGFTKLKIYSSEGTLKITQNILTKTNEISQGLQNLAAGSYFFLLSYDKEKESGKFILKK